VVYAISDQEYLLSSQQVTFPVPALGSPEWFATIERLAPFRFHGRLGHMSVHAERRQSGKAYWSAYRKYHHKQYHLYVGMTDQLSPARLEQVAARLQAQIMALGEGIPEI
jgi:hypothetical protein